MTRRERFPIYLTLLWGLVIALIVYGLIVVAIKAGAPPEKCGTVFLQKLFCLGFIVIALLTTTSIMTILWVRRRERVFQEKK